jgi:hypothetical protein
VTLDFHHFTPEALLALKWDPVVDLKVQRSDGHHSEWCGYHEATFTIGPDETGHILIPDTALDALLASLCMSVTGLSDLAFRKARASAGY